VSQCKTNVCLRDPTMVRLTSSRFIKKLYYNFFQLLEFLFSPPFPLFQALFVHLIISLVSTCLVHNCETSWRFYYFHLLLPLFCDQFPLIPISAWVTLKLIINMLSCWRLVLGQLWITIR